jgi:ADP-ribosylglycohydrolase
MALCLADSLLVRGGFDARDMRLRFLNWWYFGYCNAFGFGDERLVKSSVGLGGNVWQSIEEFAKHKTEFTTAGDLQTSGNGSLMRSRMPSHTSRARRHTKARKLRNVVASSLAAFSTAYLLMEPCDFSTGSTTAFIRRLTRLTASCAPCGRRRTKTTKEYDSRIETGTGEAATFAIPRPARDHPDYIGSYAMDALSMALHCVWSTSSFHAAVLQCVNLRGDSDTTAAITGQIAGAIYAAKAIPAKWIEAVLRWDPRSDILLRARKLYLREKVAFAVKGPRSI